MQRNSPKSKTSESSTWHTALSTVQQQRHTVHTEVCYDSMRVQQQSATAFSTWWCRGGLQRYIRCHTPGSNSWAGSDGSSSSSSSCRKSIRYNRSHLWLSLHTHSSVEQQRWLTRERCSDHCTARARGTPARMVPVGAGGAAVQKQQPGIRELRGCLVSGWTVNQPIKHAAQNVDW